MDERKGVHMALSNSISHIYPAVSLRGMRSPLIFNEHICICWQSKGLCVMITSTNIVKLAGADENGSSDSTRLLPEQKKPI